MPTMSLAAAILHGKCPRCRTGNLFSFPLSRISRFNVMNRKCAHCGVLFEPEPGFYQGAMFVGYAITVACIVVLATLLYVLWDPSEWVYAGVVVGFMVLIAPVNYRYSRILYLHFFGGIRFDSRHAQ
jgi:uncharacterized protein (DUF983 family)